MAYTAETLADFMVAKLGPTGVSLSLTDASAAITEAVTDVALILGDDITALDDDLKTRTVAEWQAWRAALGAAANQYDIGGEVPDLKRSQFFRQIEDILYAAEAAASRYTEVQAVIAAGYGTAYVTTQTLIPDPYSYLACVE